MQNLFRHNEKTHSQPLTKPDSFFFKNLGKRPFVQILQLIDNQYSVGTNSVPTPTHLRPISGPSPTVVGDDTFLVRLWHAFGTIHPHPPQKKGIECHTKKKSFIESFCLVPIHNDEKRLYRRL